MGGGKLYHDASESTAVSETRSQPLLIFGLSHQIHTDWKYVVILCICIWRSFGPNRKVDGSEIIGPFAEFLPQLQNSILWGSLARMGSGPSFKPATCPNIMNFDPNEEESISTDVEKKYKLPFHHLAAIQTHHPKFHPGDISQN